MIGFAISRVILSGQAHGHPEQNQGSISRKKEGHETGRRPFAHCLTAFTFLLSLIQQRQESRRCGSKRNGFTFFFGRGNLNSFEHLNKQRPTALPPKFLYRAFQGVPRVSEIHLWVTKLRNPSKATQRFNLIPHIIQLLDSAMLFLIWFCCGYNAC